MPLPHTTRHRHTPPPHATATRHTPLPPPHATATRHTPPPATRHRLPHATRQTFSVPTTAFEFYTPAATEIVAYTVKPISFDVYLLVGVSFYCFALHVAIQGRDAFKGLM